jgi:hypothetical protein
LVSEQAIMKDRQFRFVYFGGGHHRCGRCHP